MAGQATVKVVVLGDTSKASRALKGLSGDVDHSQSKIGKFGKGLAGFGKMAGGALLGVGVAAAGAGIAATKVGLDYSNMKDSTMVAFESLLGSGDKAKKMWGDVTSFAAKTPFETESVVQLSKQLLSAGVSAEKVIPTVNNLGNVLAANGVSGEAAERAFTAYTQVLNKGTVSMEEIQQLAEAGVPALDMLSKQLGKSKADTIKLISTGKVKAPELAAAFESAAKRSGGAMDRQSKTLAGQWSSFKDNMSIAFGEFINKLAPSFAGWIGKLTPMIGTFGTFLANKVAPAIDNLIKQISTPGTGANNFFKGVGTFIGKIGEAIKFVYPYVKQFISNGIEGLKSAWKSVSEAFKGNSSLFSTLGEGLKVIGSALVKYVLPAMGKMRGDQFKVLGKAIGITIELFADMARATIDMSIVGVKAFKALFDGFTGMASRFLAAAEKAFGWMPGIGDKIRNAKKGFDDWRKNVSDNSAKIIKGLEGIKRKISDVPDKKRLKLEAEKKDAEAKINSINKQLKQKIPTSKRTALLAEKRDAQAKIADVNRRLRQQIPWSKTTALRASNQTKAATKAAQGNLANVRNRMVSITAADRTYAGVSSAKRAIASIRGKTVSVYVNELRQASGRGVPKYAGGTRFHPGGVAMVGEEGPELVNLPRGSKVFPADKTRSMIGTASGGLPTTGGGGGNVYVYVTVEGNVTAERDLAEAIRAQLIRQGNRNGGRIF